MTSAGRSPFLTAAMAIAAFEGFALVAYCVSIGASYLGNGSQGTSGSEVSPFVLIAVYLAFATMIGLVVRGLLRGNGSARTPYLVMQAFAFVIAQTLLSGAATYEVVCGWALIVLGLAGAGAILSPGASRGLNLQR